MLFGVLSVHLEFVGRGERGRGYFIKLLFVINNKNVLSFTYPPGLVVTRASCYSCVFSKTGRQQEL